jgi:hydroxycarboxylate dehydrogenase B
VLLDGNGSFGQVAAGAAVAEAITRSRGGGSGGAGSGGADGSGGAVVVSVRSAGHLGRIGAYTEAIAAAGVVGLAFCSVPPRQHNVAWAGTREGRLGTNPISFAFPTSDDPVVADLSTSATAEGRVRLAWNEGREVPEGLIRDARGRPTTDPERFYADPPGTLEPLGGAAQGHKGSALGLLVEVMATLLTGESVDDPTRENNLTLVAIAPPPGFPALADALAAHVRSADPIEPGGAALLPGDREQQALADARAVVVDATTWCALVAHAERLGLALPPNEPVTT